MDPGAHVSGRVPGLSPTPAALLDVRQKGAGTEAELRSDLGAPCGMQGANTAAGPAHSPGNIFQPRTERCRLVLTLEKMRCVTQKNRGERQAVCSRGNPRFWGLEGISRPDSVCKFSQD